jgi:hypothetical protein
MSQPSYLSTAITSLRQQFSKHHEVLQQACKSLGLDLQQVLGPDHFHLSELVQAATQALRLKPDLKEIKEALASVLVGQQCLEEEKKPIGSPLNSK